MSVAIPLYCGDLARPTFLTTIISNKVCRFLKTHDLIGKVIYLYCRRSKFLFTGVAWRVTEKIEPLLGENLQTKLIRGGLGRTEHRETAEAFFMTSRTVCATLQKMRKTLLKGSLIVIFTLATVIQQYRLSKSECVYLREQKTVWRPPVACQQFSLSFITFEGGDRLVASKALFGSCDYIVSELLPRYGINTEFVSGTDMDQWETALRKPTHAVFVETPSNPTLEIIDLPKVSELAHAVGAKVIVDNVLATPVLQKPLNLERILSFTQQQSTLMDKGVLLLEPSSEAKNIMMIICSLLFAIPDHPAALSMHG